MTAARKRISTILGSLILLAAVACGKTAAVQTAQAPEPTPVPEGVHLAVYGEGEPTISIHSELQEQFLRTDYKSAHKLADGKEERGCPEKLTLDWSRWAVSEASASPYRVKVSEEKTFADTKEYETPETTLAIDNLKIGTLYYWTVTAADGTEGAASSFRTADTMIRNLRVDGITNVRDLGGYQTASGARVRQGMLFRCGRLNTSRAEQVNVEITEAGKQTMLEDLRIRSEIDLRQVADGEVGGITSSVLGDNVRYYSVPMDFTPKESKSDTIKGNVRMIRYLFSILADESNYPLCFHCDIGTDRTGMVAYVINGLLGVERETLYYDYLFSDLGRIGSVRTYNMFSKLPYVKTIEDSPGDTLQEKVYQCMLEIGIPSEDLDTVIRILSE